MFIYIQRGWPLGAVSDRFGTCKDDGANNNDNNDNDNNDNDDNTNNDNNDTNDNNTMNNTLSNSNNKGETYIGRDISII